MKLNNCREKEVGVTLIQAQLKLLLTFVLFVTIIYALELQKSFSTPLLNLLCCALITIFVLSCIRVGMKHRSLYPGVLPIAFICSITYANLVIKPRNIRENNKIFHEVEDRINREHMKQMGE